MTTAEAAQVAVAAHQARQERRQRAPSPGRQRVERVGDSVATAILVLLGLAVIRAIATGQGRQWFAAKFANRAGGASGGSTPPAGFVPDAGAGGSTDAGAGGTLQDPVSGLGTSPAPNSCFGAARTGHVHAGLDINVPQSSPVAAPAAGTVTSAGMGSSACGLAMSIDHGGGLVTHYCHLSGLAVPAGSRVYRGQVVAYTGGRPGSYGAGNSEAPHLHFEVYRNGTAVDPAPLIGRRCTA